MTRPQRVRHARMPAPLAEVWEQPKGPGAASTCAAAAGLGLLACHHIWLCGLYAHPGFDSFVTSAHCSASLRTQGKPAPALVIVQLRAGAMRFQ